MPETTKPREMTLPAIRYRFDCGSWDSADCLWLYAKAEQHRELLGALEELVGWFKSDKPWTPSEIAEMWAKAEAAIRKPKAECK